MYCPECGSEVKESAKFCPKCGYKIQEAGETINSVPDKPKSQKGSKAGKRILAVVVVLLILCLSGTVAYKVWNNKAVKEEVVAESNSDDKMPTSNEDEQTADDDSEDDELEDEEQVETVYLFTRVIRYSADGSINWRHEYEYDDKGNEIKLIDYNGDGSISWRHEYEYDDKGNEVKYITYNEDGSIDEWIEYEYDDKGNKVKYIRYDAEGSIKAWDEWNEHGDLIKETGFNIDDNTEYSYEYQYEYDEQGNCIKIICYDGDGSVINLYEYQYEYDELGHKTELYRNGDLIEVYECEVYSEMISRGFLTIFNQIKEEYDEQGNLIKRAWYDGNGDMSLYGEYEYDEQGNVIKDIWYDEEGNISSWNEYEYITMEIPLQSEASQNVEADENISESDVYAVEQENVGGNAIYVVKSSVEYNSNGGVLMKREYEYDEQNNQIKEVLRTILWAEGLLGCLKESINY